MTTQRSEATPDKAAMTIEQFVSGDSVQTECAESGKLDEDTLRAEVRDMQGRDSSLHAAALAVVAQWDKDAHDIFSLGNAVRALRSALRKEQP